MRYTTSGPPSCRRHGQRPHRGGDRTDRRGDGRGGGGDVRCHCLNTDAGEREATRGAGAEWLAALSDLARIEGYSYERQESAQSASALAVMLQEAAATEAAEAARLMHSKSAALHLG